MKSFPTDTSTLQSIAAHPLFWEIVAAIVITVSIALYFKVFRYLGETFRKRPTIGEFRRQLQNRSFEGVPDEKRPSYYVCAGHPSQNSGEPTYHFFVKDHVHVEEFMAFLIPPLDFGHGRQSRQESGQTEPGLEFNADWSTYLTRIGEKAHKLPQKTDADNKSLFRRLIIFDKELLLHFIEDYERIFQTARMDGKGFKKESGVPHLALRARGVIQYAFDIAAVHRKVRIYKDVIECYYLAKSIVPSSKYYDFGLYRIDGIEVVYNPIYKKDSNKSIEEERILIGTWPDQKRRIDEYKKDFEDLWELARQGKLEQESLIRELGDVHLRSPDYFELDWLSVDYFAKGYYKSLKKIFTEVFKIELA
ncbi:MAG TPA: hypothetical protein VF789_06445 [Thermoanaerobaculia bacterium]